MFCRFDTLKNLPQKFQIRNLLFHAEIVVSTRIPRPSNSRVASNRLSKKMVIERTKVNGRYSSLNFEELLTQRSRIRLCRYCVGQALTYLNSLRTLNVRL